MFAFFLSDYLILPKQSEFELGDSCSSQLISITNEVYQRFNNGYDITWNFLIMNKIINQNMVKIVC